MIPQISASLDITVEGNQVLIEIESDDGSPLTPQLILDAVADMLIARFGVLPSDFSLPEEELDS